MTDTPVIETSDLRKTYGGPADSGGPGAVEALRGLSFSVPPGSIFGFLGRNGAGKTTTIKILLGIASPTGGEARVFGLPVAGGESSVAIRRRTGFVSEDNDLYGSMTVDQIVRFTASFYPKWRHDLETKYRRSFDLPADRIVKSLSRGMRAKLALLLAFSRGADLLVLDEPTSGLDPAANEEVLQAIVSHVAREEMTVFLSSHQLADIDQIADHVAVLNHGRAVVAGSLDDIRQQYCRVQLVFESEAPDVRFHAPGVLRTQRIGRVLAVVARAGSQAIVDESRALGPVSVDVTPLMLKEIFFESVNLGS
jgi:ABC-2 type transport system ATP-binding protein